ncbi:hypothetical protein RvY_03704-2 [Ramazzottius varieornatus]|uniref:Metalloendopeptidase n=1 Tax=Ramazzottius varieornatus TaxID=947166 RepID=A0A1D1UP11_RAMVA|nr:hypothetical protein RvY_03704-2 [Ramazzottius varieornatus]
MRTLGFYYEVQRPDRFMFVAVNQSNVQTKAWGLFEKADPDFITFLGEPYDYNSATHFALDDYAVSPGSATMTILAPRQRIGQNNGLSEVDVRRINKAYRCGALVSGNMLCPDNWISALDGKCYYYSFLDPRAKPVEGPARKACEPMLAVPLVIPELSQPGRTLMLEIMRHAKVLIGVWVIGDSPMGDLLAERDGLCSTFDIEGAVAPTGTPCEGSRRHYICQKTSASEMFGIILINSDRFLASVVMCTLSIFR